MFTETAHKQMGSLIKKARRSVGLTQAGLARKLGYKSPQFCSNWERAKSLPPLKAIPKLAKATRTDCGDFAKILHRDLDRLLHQS